jgi:hypothetical protein
MTDSTSHNKTTKACTVCGEIVPATEGGMIQPGRFSGPSFHCSTCYAKQKARWKLTHILLVIIAIVFVTIGITMTVVTQRRKSRKPSRPMFDPNDEIYRPRQRKSLDEIFSTGNKRDSRDTSTGENEE